MLISLIVTVRDEEATIAALLDSILAQSLLPDEIIINDCQSRDRTAAIVLQYAQREPRIRLTRGGHNIASGRNTAIRAARGQIIASTDAGLRLPTEWLAELTAPLRAGSAMLTSGFYQPDPRSLFELSLAWTNYRHLAEIDPATFPVFGNCLAFRREVWEAVGGFPEWLDHSEDLVFSQQAAACGYQRHFTPTAYVIFRPRSSLRSFFQQYRNYARGDRMAGLWPKRHALRLATYGLILVAKLAALRWPRLRLPVFSLIGLWTLAYCAKPFRRLWPKLQGYAWPQRLRAMAFVPLIRYTGDLAKIIGYLGARRRQQPRA